MVRVDSLAELEAELRRQDEALGRLQAMASENAGGQLRLGEQIRECMGAHAEQMTWKTARQATRPTCGIAV